MPREKISLSLLVVLVLLLTGIAVCGVFFIAAQNQEFDSGIRSQLDAAADMKAHQIEGWLRERCGDAATVAAALELMPSVQHLIRGTGSREETAAVRSWMSILRSQYGYQNVTLTDRAGKTLLEQGVAYVEPDHAKRLTEATAKTRDVITFEDFHPGGQGEAPHLGLTVAIRDPQGNLQGNLQMGINPEDFLYPALNDWPGAGQTGELLLLERDGDSIVYLNRSRLMATQALQLRLPATKPNLPAAMAIRGQTSNIDGIDYRGERVLAAARPVPGSKWFLVAKQDRREAYLPKYQNTVALGVITALLVLLGGMVPLQIFRRHRAQFFREKYEAEAERGAALERYVELTRQTSDAVLLFEECGQLIEVNRSACEMFGYSQEELLKMSVADLKPDDCKDDFQKFLQVVDLQSRCTMETMNRRKNGESFPTEISCCRIEQGGKTLYQSFVRDISQRRESERQIQRLNHLYAVLSGCGEAIARARGEEQLYQDVANVVVKEGGFLLGWVGRVNPETGEVVALAKAGTAAGYLSEVKMSANSDPQGQGPTGVCIREGRAAVSTDFDAAAMSPWREAAARYSLRSSISTPIPRRGQPPMILGIYSPEPDFFGNEEVALVERVGATVALALERIDLEEERRRAEEQRRLTQERLELALDAANEGYWEHNLEQRSWYFSPRFETILGYKHAQMNIRRVVLQIEREDLRSLLDGHAALVRGSRMSHQVEYRVRNAAGQLRWVLTRARAIPNNPGPNSSGKIGRLVGTLEDITERKLLQQEFLHAQKMETLGRLAGGVAHDFNNHLTVINGFSAQLRDELMAGDPLAEGLDAIHEAGVKAARLTRQLLAFSRREPEHREPLLVNDVILGMERMLRRLMGENVALELRLASDCGQVLGDAAHVEQVVMNLAVNARDAVQNHGRVEISTEQIRPDVGALRPGRTGPFVRLSVRDDGIGMSAELQQHLFEPFFTTKDQAHGTGLGLATVYGIVDRQGGFIEVESTPGAGSTFHVYLPGAAEAEPKTAPAKQASPTPATGNGTVLVVDDMKSVRGITVRILSRHGYQVLAAESGAEALSICGGYEGKIDAVVSDLAMPGMSGVEMVRELRRTRPLVKVLYVSGALDEETDTAEILRDGSAFLAKPFDPGTLLERLRALMIS